MSGTARAGQGSAAAAAPPAAIVAAVPAAAGQLSSAQRKEGLSRFLQLRDEEEKSQGSQNGEAGMSVRSPAAGGW